MARKPVKTLAQVEEQLKAEPKKEEKDNKLLVLRKPSGLYYVSWTHAGVVPEVLKGDYTSSVVAERHIAAYEKSKEAVPYFWQVGVKTNAHYSSQ